MKRITHIDGLALAMRGRRRDLGISRARAGRMCRGSLRRPSQRLEAGIRVHPANVMRVAVTLAAFELYSEPKDPEPRAASLEVELAELVRVAA